MAYQPESAVYDVGVLQLETTTPVQGGVGGASNAPLLNLANRTAYLKAHLDALEVGAAGLAPINSPAFTGTPTAPTVALGDRSAKIATDQFVQDTVSGIAAINCAGGANVVLTAVQAGVGILNLTGLLTANISVIVPGVIPKSWIVRNATTGSTGGVPYTVTVKTAAGAGVAVAQGRTSLVWSDTVNVYDSKTDFGGLDLQNATANTQTAGDASTKLATDAFVQAAISGIATVNVAGNSNVALNQAQWGSGIIVLTGALTGNIAVTVPAAADRWIVSNQTSGLFSLTFKTAAGAGVVIPSGTAYELWCDTVDVKPVTAPTDATYPVVRKPVVQSPTAGQALTTQSPQILANSYYSLYQVPQLAAQFQVSTSPTFNVTDVDVTVGPQNYAQVPQGSLLASTVYYTRCRYQDLEQAWSPWSDTVSFTTGTNTIQAPSITAPANGATNVGDGTTLTSNAFAMTSGVDTHASTDWEIWTGAGGTGTLVFSSYADSVNKQSIAVPAGTFAQSTVYYPRVRYNSNGGGTSAWSANVQFTTIANFGTVLAAGGAYGGGFFVGYITLSGQRYALIVSDNTGHVRNGDLNGGSDNTGMLSTSDGKANMAAYIARGRYSGGNDAVNFCKNYRGGGYSDWYLPSLFEAEMLYRNLKPTTGSNNTAYGANVYATPNTANYLANNPAQTAATNFQRNGGGTGVDTLYQSSDDLGSLTYQSATQNGLYSINLNSGVQRTHGAGNNMNYRCVRRVPA
jgi:hypothetical protein